MQKPAFDPGLTQQYTGTLRRVIGKNGRFNVRRRGGSWHDYHPYLHLINMGWLPFLAWLLFGYVVVNTLFAAAYYALGPGALNGDVHGRMLTAFFFSAQTLTTVGYGNISPHSLSANVVSMLEALTGVLGLAVATGLLFGRVSRPSAKIGFSDTMVIAPYQDVTALQFRVVNRRANELMEIEARVLLMTVDLVNPQKQRTYKQLRLERDGVLFLPLTWTVVHPIDQESPLWGMTAEQFEQQQAEVMILIKAYDDTFSQTVFARYSYRHEEIEWNRKFAAAFSVDADGDLVLDLDRVGRVSDTKAAG